VANVLQGVDPCVIRLPDRPNDDGGMKVVGGSRRENKASDCLMIAQPALMFGEFVLACPGTESSSICEVLMAGQHNVRYST